MPARENQQAEIYGLTTEALQGENPPVAAPVEALAGSVDDTLTDDFILTELRATK